MPTKCDGFQADFKQQSALVFEESVLVALIQNEVKDKVGGFSVILDVVQTEKKN